MLILKLAVVYTIFASDGCANVSKAHPAELHVGSVVCWERILNGVFGLR